VSQQYDEELEGATSTDAAEQGAVDPSVDGSTTPCSAASVEVAPSSPSS